MSQFKTKIFNIEYYEREIERIQQKLIQHKKYFYSETDLISFSAISCRRAEVAKIMVESLRYQTYKSVPAYSFNAVIKGKSRELYKFDFLTRIMHGVVATILAEEFNHKISKDVYSYRKKKSTFEAVNNFSAYIRSHKKRIFNPKQRGLYVLRKDIQSYTDSIQVQNNAAVWQKLLSYLRFDIDSEPEDKYFWQLIQSLIRPEIISSKCYNYTKTIGLATGSPLTAFLYNLCGTELDKLCGAVSGAFYARYSDDFIFAHPNYEIILQVESEINQILKEQGLKISSKKNDTIYFNGAARKSEVAPDVKGSDIVEFLGARINFNEGVSLSQKRTRIFLKNLRKRIVRSCRVFKESNIAIDPNEISAIVNKSLSYDCLTVVPERASKFLFKVSTDRSFLKQLDYLIALMVSEEISGVSGPKSFRKISRKHLITKCGLQSINHMRNLNQKSA